MPGSPGNPFQSIEGTQEFLFLMLESIRETAANIAAEEIERREAGQDRHADALRLIQYKLDRLQWHTSQSGRLLNDLRSLRRLLYGERDSGTVVGERAASDPGDQAGE